MCMELSLTNSVLSGEMHVNKDCCIWFQNHSVTVVTPKYLVEQVNPDTWWRVEWGREMRSKPATDSATVYREHCKSTLYSLQKRRNWETLREWGKIIQWTAVLHLLTSISGSVPHTSRMKSVWTLVLLAVCAVMVVAFHTIKQEMNIHRMRNLIVLNTEEVKTMENEIMSSKLTMQKLSSQLAPLDEQKKQLIKSMEEQTREKENSEKSLNTCQIEKVKKMTEIHSNYLCCKL